MKCKNVCGKISAVLALGFVNMSAVSILHIGPRFILAPLVSLWDANNANSISDPPPQCDTFLLNHDELKYPLRIFVADPCVKMSFSSRNLNDNESSHRHRLPPRLSVSACVALMR